MRKSQGNATNARFNHCPCVDMPNSDPASAYCDAAPFSVHAQGQALTFYPHGADRLAALVEHIEQAKTSLHCFYFLYQPDDSGTRVRDALSAAAGRGVDVRLYIDDFASGAPSDFFAPLIEAGGQFRRFSPDWNVQYLIRNHQKFVIADRARVMTGGFNISDEYFDPPDKDGWCDLGVLIEGPVAERFEDWFDCLEEWIASDGSQFRKVRRMVRDWDPGDGPVQLLLGGPSVRTRKWGFRVKQDLARSKRIDLVTAYFTPPRSVRRALRRAARTSKLRLILASKSDFAITVTSGRLHYRRLVKAGARLFEFLPCKLHMTLLVMDDISYFGSGNLDMRSIRLNLEIMVRIEDAALADRLRELIDHLEAASEPVDESWFKRNGGFFTRIKRFASSFMLRFVDYNVSRNFALPPPNSEGPRDHS